nr:MAG TPA: hypothetical protein [Caudoviricetes sp.]
MFLLCISSLSRNSVFYLWSFVKITYRKVVHHFFCVLHRSLAN